jgi:hypothetical protein
LGDSHDGLYLLVSFSYGIQNQEVLYAVAADRQVTRITYDDFVRRHHLKNEEKKQNGSPVGELF